MDMIFLTKKQTALPILLSVAANRIGKTVNIYDLSRGGLLSFAKPGTMTYPYHYSNETILLNKRERAGADLNFFVYDDENDIPTLTEATEIVFVTDMILRSARYTSDAFRHFVASVKDGKQSNAHFSLVIENYLDTRYTHRAVQDAIGLKFVPDNVFCVTPSAKNISVEVAVDQAGKIKLKRLGKDYKQTILGLLEKSNERVSPRTVFAR